MFDFDTPIAREGTNAEKYTALKRLYGREDILPFWVADMEFAIAPAVSEALAERIDHPIYGYTSTSESLRESIYSWNARRYGLRIDSRAITIIPGVMSGVSAAVLALSDPGDAIVVQPPLYPPLMQTVSRNGRKLVENQLVLQDGKYVMNLVELEKLFQEYRPKLMLLCSPHNPVGRVWTSDELTRLLNLTHQYDVCLVSDEIHADIVFAPHKHVSALSICPEKTSNVIVLNSASKSFNVAGLNTAYALIPDAQLQTSFRQQLRRMNLHGANTIGMVALEAAYAGAEEWLDALLVYLQANREFISQTLDDELSDLQHFVPEGTYLYWLDFTSLGLTGAKIRRKLIDEARVGLNDGLTFSRNHEGFWRLNFAVPRSMLQKGLERIVDAFQ